MQAILLSDFLPNLSSLTVSNDVPVPTLTPEKPILVRITHTSVNHVDLLYALGRHQNNHSGLVRPPFVLGLEFAGTVDSILGPGGQWKVGDRVYGSGGGLGGFAEYIAVSPGQIRRVPDGWRLSEAAGLGVGTAPVSYGALVRWAVLQPGESVLVHAVTGSLGVSAAQIARGVVGRQGRVVGTVGSVWKKQWAESHPILRRTLDGVVVYDRDGWEREVVSLTPDHRGVDVVYDTVGLVRSSLRCVKFGGRIVIAGFAGLFDGGGGGSSGGNQDPKGMEKVATNLILLKNARVLGYRYGESGRRDPAEHARIWHGLDAMIRSRQVKAVMYRGPEEELGGPYRGFEGIVRAMRDLARRAVVGKAVIEIVAESGGGGGGGGDDDDDDGGQRIKGKI